MLFMLVPTIVIIDLHFIIVIKRKKGQMYVGGKSCTCVQYIQYDNYCTVQYVTTPASLKCKMQRTPSECVHDWMTHDMKTLGCVQVIYRG